MHTHIPPLDFHLLQARPQPSASKLLSQSHGPLVFFASYAAFTRSLPPPPFQPHGLTYVPESCRVSQTFTQLLLQKRREVIVDLSITVGIPVLQMALGERVFIFLCFTWALPYAALRVPEYIVAGHRFNIIEDFGCSPATWNTPLAYVLVFSWPLIIALISAGYGGRFHSAFPPLQAPT